MKHDAPNNPDEPRGPRHWDEAVFNQQEKAADPNARTERTEQEWQEIRRSQRDQYLVEQEIAGKLVMRPEEVRYIIIHCSRTAPGQDIGAVDLGRMHRLKGRLELGYHYVITRSGEVQVGRPEFKPGCHTRDHNHHSIAICLVGGRDLIKDPADNFTPPQRDALRQLLSELHLRFNEAKVVGHSDLDPRQHCPAFDVQKFMAT